MSVRILLTPAIRRGEIITIPSGTFCRAIPNVTDQAALLSVSLKPTPAAIPSGNLCRAMASTKRRTLFRFELLACCSGSNPVMACRCGVNASNTFRNKAPTITPMAIVHHPPVPAPSTAGSISPTVDAAYITPAQ